MPVSGSSNPPRKHSAFDVLLGKRKQPSTPPSPALQSLQRAVSKAGGTLSPIADSPAAKRIHTPTGESSYAACPICSKSVPRALLDTHTNGCIDTRASQPATPSGGAGAASGATPPQTASEAQQDAQPPAEHDPAAAVAAAASQPGGGAARAGPAMDGAAQSMQKDEGRQAQRDGGAGPAAHPSGAADTASGPAGAGGRAPGGESSQQARMDGSGVLQKQVNRGLSQQPATAALGQQQGTETAKAPCAAASTTAAAAVPPPPKGGNAFAALMQRQRQLAQVQHFFLERCADGGWKWHWWIKAPGAGGDAPGASQSASQGASQGGGSRPSSKSVWSSSAAVNFGVGAKINMKLLTNVPPGDGGEVCWASQKLPSNTNEGRFHGQGGGAGPLKSALQKNVRLCRAHSAVRVALYLLKENAVEFLRRFCVICIEDAVMHSAFPALVWLMAAVSKGYTLGRNHINLLLTIVQQVAAVPVQDSSQPPAAAPPSDEVKEAGDAADSAKTRPADQRLAAIDEQLAPGEAAVVKALLLRAAFGGMQGDQAMLHRFATLWQGRFAGSAGPPPPLPPPTGRFAPASPANGAAAPSMTWLQYVHEINDLNGGGAVDVALVGPMRKADIPLSAIDFHCSTISDDVQQEPQILAAGNEVVDQDTGGLLEGVDDAFRRAMWLFRSSTNKKQPLTGPAQRDGRNRDMEQLLEPLWRVASGPVDEWSKIFIRKRFY